MARAVCAAALVAGAALVSTAVAQPKPAPAVSTNLAFSVGSCGGSNAANTLTYSAISAQSAQTDFVWSDPFNNDTIGQTFVFNICQDVSQTSLSNYPYCTGTTIGSPAWQVDTINQVCYRLGASARNRPSNYSVAVYDQSYPANGFVLTYSTGQNQFCGTNTARMFNLVFMCADRAFPQAGPTHNTSTYVEETNTCQYYAYSFSSVGCPTQCPMTNGHVCSGNGVCGWDSGMNSGNGAARCFCDDDYMEVDCATPRSPYPSGSIAGATIGGILVGAAAIAAYSFFVVRKRSAGPAVEGFYGNSMVQ